ncbi:MAG: site-specific DNA-methyltransferase [Candidatus Portiera sp.]|nr:site-specific DNA-methyltransferase [Portiera sp.]
MASSCKIINKDCLSFFKSYKGREVDLTFLDPPFNQGKDYNHFDDKQSHDDYWNFILSVLEDTYRISKDGAGIYFMQREKNTQFVLSALEKSGWHLHNLIIWKKMTSAVPCINKFSKSYQVIAYATKGKRPQTFNKLKISPPIPAHYKHERDGGIYITDVWDDIRELTAGYFASAEAIRNDDNSRFHKQQAPIALLLRIILSSSKVGDLILDPFAGTGTTSVTALQLNRDSIGVEIDPNNVKCLKNRTSKVKAEDDISNLINYYRYSEGLDDICGFDIDKMDEKSISKESHRNKELAFG